MEHEQFFIFVNLLIDIVFGLFSQIQRHFKQFLAISKERFSSSHHGNVKDCFIKNALKESHSQKST